MGFGLFSTGSSGVGLKINDNNYWFADAGNPRIRVGSSNNYLSYQSSSDLLEVTGTIKANSGNIGGEFGWQIEGSKIFSGSDETYIALQSSGEISPLSISSIVINDEGNGLSSIYILSQIPSGYNSSTVEELIGTSLSLDSETSIVLTSPNDIESLTGYSYPIKEVSNFQWSISNGDAIEGSPVSEGYVTFIIYGEDNNQTFVDETLSGLTGEIINVGIAGSGIYIGSETPTDAPFSVNQNGILKASSGKIGGFNFESVSDEGAGGSFISDSENFERDVYSSPYGIELSPTNGIILRANSSLADSTSYFIEGTETLYPSGENAPEEYRNILRATGFTIIDNTGAASNVTINPFMGIRSESVSALNIAKNGSFEYKAGSSTSYTYSGVGWTAGTGLTLSSLSATTSGYSFPSLPYGQQFVGKLSWTTAVSEFLKTEFLLDPSGDEQNYLSPESSLTYLTAGSNGIAVDFAVYNSEPSGLFGTNHYVAAYPISDLKVTYTDTDGITQEIKPFNSSSLQVSDMLKNITNDEVIFDGGYLYLSAPYSNNILTFAVTATSGIVIDEGVGDGSATLTIGTHPFYAGQYVSLFNGTTDLGEEDVFEILSVTATQIVVDDSFYNITGVNTVKSDGSFIYSSSATRGKNGINFNIPLSEYEDADYSLPFTLHLPGYYYGVTFDVLVSREATFTRASSPEIPLEINFDPTIATINNYDAQYPALEPLSLLSTDTVAVFDSDLPGEGSYDLIYNTSQNSLVDSLVNSTTINIVGDQIEYFPINSFSLVLDQNNSTKEYVKVSAVDFVLGGSEETSLDIYSILFDDEGDGYSSIYIEVGDPNNLIQDPDTTGIYPEVSFSEIGSGSNETKLENFTYILQRISSYPYSLEGGSATEGEDELPEGRKIIIIYGEDAGQTVTDQLINYDGTPKLITFYESSFTQLTVSRGKLGTSESSIVNGDKLVTIERIQITDIEDEISNYYNVDQAITQLPEKNIIPKIEDLKISNSSVAFDELIISDSSISYFDGDTGGGSKWGVDSLQPETWSYRPAAVIAQLGGNPLVVGNSPGLSLIKQVSYEPFTYLLENPSITVQQWDPDPSQSALVMSGGKFSVSSNEPKIELISGTSANNNGMVNLDGSKIRFMDSHTGTTGLVIGPWLGNSPTFLVLSPNTYSGNGYGLLFSNNTTYMSSSTGGKTIIRGPNNSTSVEVELGTSVTIKGATSISGNLTAPNLTATGRIKGIANYKEAAYTGSRGASTTYLAAAKVSLTGVSVNSSVLLMATGSFNPSTSNTYVNIYIARGTSRISYIGTVQASNAGNNQPIAIAVIDAAAGSPNQEYTVFMRAINGTAEWGADTGALRLTALELF